MRYKNANIFVDDHFILGSFTVENGVFTEISEDTTSAGEDLAALRGSQANDPLRTNGKTVWTASNHNGGINGGITNGMPVIFRAAIKPTPSIARAQRTVDVAKRENAVLEIAGRHDPCIVPRAVVVMESILAIALCELEMDDAAQRALTEGVCT